MDDADAWAELQRLAANAEAANELEASEVTAEDITRWCTLFNYTRLEAQRLIETQRADISKERVSDSHWDLIRHRFEPAGYDKEAYEHAQSLEDVLQTQSTTISGLDLNLGEQAGQELFVFRLGGLLDTLDKVKEIAGMDSSPRTVQTRGEMGWVTLCVVGQDERKKIQDWLRSKRLGQ